MAQNHLYRSVKDRKIAGIAGGIGEYLNIDSAIVRLIWLLAILFGGAGFLAYIIAWIVIPEKNDNINDNSTTERTIPNEDKTESTGGLNFLGVLLIVFGGILLLREFIPYGLIRYFWPIVIIGLGIFLIIPKK